MEHAVYTHITKIFEQLPIYHYGAFSNLMQQASEYILEYGKVLNLLQDKQNNTSKDIFETINIKSTADHEIKMPAIKCSCGRPPNNKRIRSADEENKENRIIDNAANYNKLKIPAVKHGCGRPPKTDVVKQNSDNNGVYINPNIPQDAILQVYDPIGDSHCRFRSLVIAILKDENRWRDVKVIIRDYLSKRREMYGNILGYDVKQLIDILSYTEPEYLQDYWFYIPECAQLASDAFNVPVVIFGADPTASFFFLPFNQKPGRRKKSIILHWRENNHIMLVQIKPNKNIHLPPLNPQYLPGYRQLDFSEDWITFFS
ncbi:hypothetical protein C2G38_2220621 [Gigaspora rosea]|uniref:OTU domain-containing protein n=1 Tax=Gigaspora rosea TaxID=44941 RepID=A0A397U7M1_9GLOM|nr:hypothetical protein C2G38_2220621 [Gigaspora rosea]